MNILPIEAPGEMLTIGQGDTIRIGIELTYKTEAITVARIKLAGAIGTLRDSTFDPAYVGGTYLDLPPSSIFTTIIASVDVATGRGIQPGIYDIYTKLTDYPEVNAMLPQCVTVEERQGLVDTISGMIGMMMMIMMMSMMMPMMEDMGE